jgi:GDP-D-mannose dehydratase
MLQQPGTPEDFVIATGRQENVRRFIEPTALELGWDRIITGFLVIGRYRLRHQFLKGG